MAGRYDFHADQGVTFDRTITWKDHTGSPINVSGFSARMQIRDRIGGTVLHEFNSGDGSIVLGGSSGPTGGNRLAFYLSGQIGVPASFDPTSAGTATTFIPLYGVSGS